MNIFNESGVTQVKTLLQSCKLILIFAHKSPDGDSVGSSVGLYHYLRKKGYAVRICHPDPAPHFLDWMKGTEDICNAEENKEEIITLIDKADLIFCLDFNTLNRVGILGKYLKNATAPKVVIDHHLHPSDEFDIVFSNPESCSTAQLIFDFIRAMGDEELLEESIGNAIYCGIMTDTGSFRFPSVTAHTHEVISVLIKNGVKPYKIHESVFDINTFEKLRLRSYAIYKKLEVLEQHQTTLISLDKFELEQFHYVKGDTEGLVNVGLSILGIKKSILLTEKDGIIRISFRSKGEENPVNNMASSYFQGGGHANASGGKWEGTMEEAINRIKEVLPKFD